MPEFLVSSTTGRDERFYAKAIVSTRNFKYKKNIFKKMLKYVRMEVPKNAEIRCRNSVITKLNIAPSLHLFHMLRHAAWFVVQFVTCCIKLCWRCLPYQLYSWSL